MRGRPRLWVFIKLYHIDRALQSLMDTALEFMKLEKIELGGVQGKSLSAQVVSVHEEFQEQYKVFAEGTYDCLDPAQPV